MKRITRPAAGLAALFILTGVLSAQTGAFIGPQIGYSSQKPGLSEVDFNTHTTYLYGLRLGFKIMMLSLEVNYFQAAHNLDPEELPGLDWEDREISYNYIGLNMKYFFPVLVLHPYVTVGYGYYGANITEIDSDRQKGFNIGIGAELHMGSKVSLLAEGKYHRAKLDIDERELTIGDFSFSGGFNIYF